MEGFIAFLFDFTAIKPHCFAQYVAAVRTVLQSSGSYKRSDDELVIVARAIKGACRLRPCNTS